MNVLVIGGGGREHALARKIAESPLVKQLYIAPGNPGTAALGTNAAITPLEGTAVAAFAQSKSIDLVVIGPEAPLADGMADVLRAQGIKVVGPGKAGAVLESSKEWSKRFMARHGIPTAAYASFDSSQMDAALAYVRAHSLPVVVKASGLAAGKGVVICENHAEAEAAVRDMLGGEAFGEAGATIVVEEFLTGIEVSVFVLTDGRDYVLLPEAKDYKRIGEGDTGPNTGGMGAVSPVYFADAVFMDKVKQQIIAPTIAGLAAEQIDYRGFIFFGLIKVGDAPYVIEYNSRMGDPETEAVMPRIASDFVPALLGCAEGNLAGQQLAFRDGYAVTVVVVSGGYPGAYPKGKQIALAADADGILFHAGTALDGQGRLCTSGGRVFAATGLGADLGAARAQAYTCAAGVDFEGKSMRRDIGLDLR